MLKLAKDATPATAPCISVPDSVPPPAFVPIATVTLPVNPVALLLFASSAVTWTAGVIAAPAVLFVGCTVNTSLVATPEATMMLAVWATATVLIVAETVFDSATVELKLPVATPLALVVPTGCVRVFPVPVAASTTAAPAIGLPFASLAVTVMVDVPLPAVIGDVAATVDCAAETVPAFTTTVAVWVIATVLIVAETVFDSATVELKLPVATPLALVVPTGCVRVFPVPVAASTTVAPAIGLPNGSLAVTVIGELPLPAVIGEVAVTVDCAADTAAARTVTVAVWVTVTLPFTVAVTVFVPATVELKVPVIWPFAAVAPTGCVSVFPVPVAARPTVAPLTGFPLASRTVTVMVDALDPLDAVIMTGAAPTSDCAALGPPAVPVAVNVTGLPVSVPDVAVRVLVPAVGPKVQLPTVAMPLPLVVWLPRVMLPPPEAMAKLTATPATGFANWSRTITDGGVATVAPTVPV